MILHGGDLARVADHFSRCDAGRGHRATDALNIKSQCINDGNKPLSRERGSSGAARGNNESATRQTGDDDRVAGGQPMRLHGMNTRQSRAGSRINARNVRCGARDPKRRIDAVVCARGIGGWIRHARHGSRVVASKIQSDREP